MKLHLPNIGGITLSILLCELAGVLGSVFSFSAIPTWYAGLTKPALNPPSWVFGPVWTLLYLFMGIAVFFVWQRGWKKREGKIAIGVFCAQLLLNTIWSLLFFGMRNPFYALIDIIALWILILVTIVLFYRLSKPASTLLVPYLVWVSFALYLNYMIYVLN